MVSYMELALWDHYLYLLLRLFFIGIVFLLIFSFFRKKL